MQKASTRRRKAYGVALRVGLSYLGLYLVAKIRGKAYWSARIKEKNKKNAERIKDVMLELQGLFIKAGQLISTLSNVLPEEFRAPLEQLQDDVPPHNFQKIAGVIQRELGKPITEIFTAFEEQPIAAASIGQAHRAKIGDKDVVVKVQHPKIDELAHVDLAIIKKLVKLVARFMKIKGIEHLYQQVEQMIEEELDYYQEAESMQLIKQNLVGETQIYIPAVYTEYSSKRVLTIEYCEGVKVSDLDQIQAWGLDLGALAEALVQVYCQMILVDGFYHADPHPGNLLVNQKGQLILLDFGAVSKLSDEMKKGIPKLIQHVIEKDAEEMVKVLRKLGFIAHGDDNAKIAKKMIDKVQDFVEHELQLDTLNVQDISEEQLRKAFQLINIKEMTQIMQIPKDWVLLNRAVVLVSGVVFLLKPDWNPIHTLKPYLEQELMGGKGGFAQMALNLVRTQVSAAVTLPVELQKVIRKTNQGKLEVEVKELKEGFKQLQKIGQQLIWLLLFFASIYFYLLLDAKMNYPNLCLFFQFLGGGSFLGFAWTLLHNNET
ncbi:ABC1 kinase family protein [Aureispira anguillae]|nr:AarF/UbiB family protein [Aureispira anguillae]